MAEFLIKCSNCNWNIKTNGSKKDISDLNLVEIVRSCSSCGKPRRFKCQKCRQSAKMFRLS
jgi:predicted RNA-binding Zn-ribbon protein involved in translation (DUF1610 family)